MNSVSISSRVESGHSLRISRHNTQAKTARRLKLQNLIDPVSELGDARVDARLIGLRAANAPRDDAAQLEALVRLALQHHGATGIPCE